MDKKKIFKFENKNLKFDNISQEYSSLINLKIIFICFIMVMIMANKVLD